MRFSAITKTGNLGQFGEGISLILDPFPAWHSIGSAPKKLDPAPLLKHVSRIAGSPRGPVAARLRSPSHSRRV